MGYPGNPQQDQWPQDEVKKVINLDGTETILDETANPYETARPCCLVGEYDENEVSWANAWQVIQISLHSSYAVVRNDDADVALGLAWKVVRKRMEGYVEK